MTIMEKVLALHEVELFANMSTEELSVLASIAEEDQFDAGSRVIAKHESADSLNLVLTGKVQVKRGEQEIFVAGPSDTLGALSMLHGEPWLFSAEVIEPTTVLVDIRFKLVEVVAVLTRARQMAIATLADVLRLEADGHGSPSCSRYSPSF